jgi:hypothetical protein
MGLYVKDLRFNNLQNYFLKGKCVELVHEFGRPGALSWLMSSKHSEPTRTIDHNIDG